MVADTAERLVELEGGGADDHRHHERGRPRSELEHDQGHDRDRDPGEQASHEIGGRPVRAGRDGGLLFLEGAGGRRAPRLPAAAVASAPAGCHLGLEGVVIAVVSLGKVAIT